MRRTQKQKVAGSTAVLKVAFWTALQYTWNSHVINEMRFS